jgi:hypothetical protein
MELTTATLPSGSVYPAVQVGKVLLAHPQLSLEKLDNNYEKAVVNALQKETNQANVISAAGPGYQFMLPLGKNWKAPMSVHKGYDGQVIALLHYGTA